MPDTIKQSPALMELTTFGDGVKRRQQKGNKEVNRLRGDTCEEENQQHKMKGNDGGKDAILYIGGGQGKAILIHGDI